MKISLFLILISLSFRLAAQDYIKYHLKIREAENLIIKNNLEDAVLTYDTAFKMIPIPFGRDYYNASVCNVKTKKTQRAFELLSKLASKGFAFKYIETSVFKPLKKEIRWVSFTKHYQKELNIFQNNLNQRFVKEINDLALKDQFFRAKSGSYKKYGDTIRKIDHLNMIKILSIIDSCGLPTEEMIGIKNKFDDQGYDIVILHYCQQRSRNQSTQNLLERLDKALNLGQLDPYTYSFWLSLQNDKHLPNYEASPIYKFTKENKWRYTLNSKEKKDLIDQNRKKIGLESSDDFREKALFSLQKKEFTFGIHGCFSEFDLSEKYYILFKDSMIIDEKNTNN
jgi:hypothetical protein